MKKTPGRTIHVVNNTHWDREWQVPFEAYRKKLVNYVDMLIELMEQNTSFKHFLLDGQTICIEDYLEIRPERTERIRALVKTGRLLVGPWYTPPDMNLTCGEAVVRNLLIGIKEGDYLGGAMKVGYTPCSNGQISQLPQIYAGFGINSIVIYKGIWQERRPREFLWFSPDGTGVFTIRLSSKYGRAEFFCLVLRQVVFDFPDKGGRKYEPSDNALPYRVDGHRFLGPVVYHCAEKRENFNLKRLKGRLERLCGFAGKDTSAANMIAFNGMDHTPPFAATPELIKEADGLIRGLAVKESSLPEAISALKTEVEPSGLEKHEGEFRDASRGGDDRKLNMSTLSARMDIKTANRETEHILVDRAEPLCALAWIAGHAYPKALLEHAWKLLLANHAHDSIDGCNSDKVNSDVMGRFSDCRSLCETLIDEAAGCLLKHILTFKKKNSPAKETGQRILVLNTSPFSRNAVCEMEIDIIKEGPAGGVRLIDNEGRELPCQYVDKGWRDVTLQVRNTLGLPMEARRRKLLFEVNDLPAMGWVQFTLGKGNPDTGQQRVSTKPNQLENENLKVKIQKDGRLDVTCKETGKLYSGLHYFSDRGDSGDPWISRPVPGKPVTSINNDAEITCVENGPLRAVYRVRIVMKIPESSVDARNTTADLIITSHISLTRTGKWVDLRTVIDNSSRYHKLTACFPAGIPAESTYAGGQYDMVIRPVKPPYDMSKWPEPLVAYPNFGFFGIEDEADAFTVLNHGLPEYFVDDEDSSVLTLTLLRSAQLKKVWPEGHDSVIGGHCFGKTTCRYAIYPHTGRRKAGALFQDYQEFAVNPVAIEYFGPHAPSERGSFINIDSSTIRFSCIKKSEDSDDLIIRLWNSSDEQAEGNLSLGFDFSKARAVGLDEISTDDNVSLKREDSRTMRVCLGAKKISTLRISVKKADFK